MQGGLQLPAAADATGFQVRAEAAEVARSSLLREELALARVVAAAVVVVAAVAGAEVFLSFA
jgi:hypothetical protein